ncbi:MAG: hypothetical protein EOM50_08490 [Erysipelotrichia bacterium]|nr:hypothetical protein [Erysipelotrichia bacterium]NCC54951.1 hypothetical protein [Erysipelotrichia bacterium]
MEKEKLIQLLKEQGQKEGIYDDSLQMNEMLNQYVHETYGFYKVLSQKDAIAHMISEENYRERYLAKGCEELGVWIRPGDICYIDFGNAYLNEAGFQHFGLIMKIVNNKACVVPMTSNQKTYQEAIKCNGKQHLMAIGKVKGMNKNSVLFLNDFKSINTARIIDVKAHIPIDSKLFMQIKQRLLKVLF